MGQSFSCDFLSGSVFLWENGSMIDLDAFVPPGSGSKLPEAQAINDRGEIGGDLLPPGCTQDTQCGHAYVLIPCGDEHTDEADCEEGDQATATANQNNHVLIDSPSTAMISIGRTPREIAARIRTRLGRSRGFGKCYRCTFCLLWIPLSLTGQDQQAHPPKHHRYRFVDVGTFGGPVSYLANDPSGDGAAGGILNRHGRVVSAADTSIPDPNYPNTCLVCPGDPFIVHAFRWRNGVLADLGALPGINSSFANWISNNGLVAGFSEDGAIDPLLGLPEVNAVLWKEGHIINLGTLEGGFESNALAVNNRGQVAGVFVNTVPDPFSPFGLQVRAFIWETGTMADIGTLGGPDASAMFLNEHRQVVGFSYINSTPNPPIGFGPCISANGLPTQEPFLWEEGKMTDLGTLGGTCGVPNGINNRGEVVGLSNVAEDQSYHPFLWTKTKVHTPK